MAQRAAAPRARRPAPHAPAGTSRGAVRLVVAVALLLGGLGAAAPVRDAPWTVLGRPGASPAAVPAAVPAPAVRPVTALPVPVAATSAAREAAPAALDPPSAGTSPTALDLPPVSRRDGAARVVAEIALAPDPRPPAPPPLPPPPLPPPPGGPPPLGGPAPPPEAAVVVDPAPPPPWAGAPPPSGPPLDVPDPAIVGVPGGFLAFSTESRGRTVPVLGSPDLVTWHDLGDALAALPGWARPGATWAPDVLRRGDRWVLYYATVQRDTELHCLSLAVSDRPAGPYVDDSPGPLLCHETQGGAIDPSPFVDADGTPYLLWKSEGIPGAQPTRIWVAPLTADGLALAGEATELLRQDRAWEAPIIEGPDLVLVDGVYHLFYSANRWETADYAVGHARCDTVRGPCLRTREGPLLPGGGPVAGPGGPDVVGDPAGGHWLAYHAWTPEQVGYPDGTRRLHLQRLLFVDGQPGLGEAPPAPAPAPEPPPPAPAPPPPEPAVTAR